MLGGTPAKRDLGLEGWGSMSGAKMAAVVALSLRRRFPAAALGGARLQVSRGAGRGARAGVKVAETACT